MFFTINGQQEEEGGEYDSYDSYDYDDDDKGYGYENLAAGRKKRGGDSREGGERSKKRNKKSRAQDAGRDEDEDDEDAKYRAREKKYERFCGRIFNRGDEDTSLDFAEKEAFVTRLKRDYPHVRPLTAAEAATKASKTKLNGNNPHAQNKNSGNDDVVSSSSMFKIAADGDGQSMSGVTGVVYRTGNLTERVVYLPSVGDVRVPVGSVVPTP